VSIVSEIGSLHRVQGSTAVEGYSGQWRVSLWQSGTFGTTLRVESAVSLIVTVQIVPDVDLSRHLRAWLMARSAKSCLARLGHPIVPQFKHVDQLPAQHGWCILPHFWTVDPIDVRRRENCRSPLPHWGRCVDKKRSREVKYRHSTPRPVILLDRNLTLQLRGGGPQTDLDDLVLHVALFQAAIMPSGCRLGCDP
jgi:hypothetical protein